MSKNKMPTNWNLLRLMMTLKMTIVNIATSKTSRLVLES